MEGITKFFSSFSEWFSELPGARKAMILAALGMFLAGLMVMSFWIQKPEYQVLFSNLAQEDSIKIIEKLKGQNIPYQLKQSGRTVMVPSDQVHETRLQLAGEGLPSGGGVGFEIFDKPSLGMTEFIQNLNFKRALEGELARTISQLDAIDTARVHIAMPKKSLFAEKEEKPTASVVIKVKSSGRLKDAQVEGIGHLVASSVEGLAAEDVAIIDMHGNVLSDGADGSGLMNMTRTQIEHQRGIEKRLEDRARTMLESILGPGKAIIRVSAEINFEQVEKEEETFDPESQVARSEQRSEESNVGSSIPSGIPGPASNIPGATTTAPAAPAMTPPTSNKSRETINYELNKVVKKVIQQVGEVKRLSVAVIVDGTYEEPEKGAEEGAKRKYLPRAEEDMKKYRAIVERAVGFDPKRGDTMEVANAPFDTTLQDEAARALEEAEKHDLIYNAGKYGVTAIFVILLFIMVLKPLLAYIGTITENLEALRPEPLVVETEEAEGGEGGQLDLAVPDKVEFRKMVSDYAVKDPQHTAELLRKWLKEKR